MIMSMDTPIDFWIFATMCLRFVDFDEMNQDEIMYYRYFAFFINLKIFKKLKNHFLSFFKI